MRYQDVQATKDGPVDSWSPLGRVTQGFCLLHFQGFILDGWCMVVPKTFMVMCVVLLKYVYFGSFWKITDLMRFGYLIFTNINLSHIEVFELNQIITHGIRIRNVIRNYPW